MVKHNSENQRRQQFGNGGSTNKADSIAKKKVPLLGTCQPSIIDVSDPVARHAINYSLSLCIW
jgi:hypothetical protein